MSALKQMLPGQIFAASFHVELRALQAFQNQLHERSLELAIECLYGCRGKIVCTGSGKCGFIAQKIAATLVSTGTPALFLHPPGSLLAGLSAVHEEDVALILSYSGETQAICELLPHLKQRDIPVVALTGRPDSTLGRCATHCIITDVEREAEPLAMRSTASTTLMLAVGDALAPVLRHRRIATSQQETTYRAGASLGQKLLCRVEDLSHTGKDLPTIGETVLVRDAIYEMTSKRLGTVFVRDESGRLAGILTDGDLRRLFQRESQPLDLPLGVVMTRNPHSIVSDALAVDALRQMEDSMITILAVLDRSGALVGAIHIHDILRAGIS
ncbi:MAG: KpsF/GutQ family sugar-phosphate isomerase [Candidatus Hydrogenedentes bacterium]|nr:KpsF/GutQ family sugar-phosphate isomerase [Candidatus Hydrogenedentota bacterium]